ncbi:hypothetical protein [Streptomyces sp. NPDC127072]|uniref:hypothetical protein n=1 Tax=Streptomyces sp. NPDC127072 TaxID=3347129 RepID=UPI003654BAD3
MTAARPSVGRIVHYVSYGTPGGEYASQCRAAIVTAVPAGSGVSLAVLNPEGMFFNQNCPQYEPDGAGMPPGGSWHWPEREEA